MVESFYFGESPRLLAGALHPAARRTRTLLVCPPLLHDAVRSRRSLWALCEAQAAAGCDALRFDWYGTGDSSGESADVSVSGLIDDLGAARSLLRTIGNDAPQRLLGLRSGCLPLLAFAAMQAGPVDLVLWDADLNGAAVVQRWRAQHVEQLREAGRYPYGHGHAADNEMLGFAVAPALLDDLSALDFTSRPLPVGSRVLVAGWQPTADVERFISTQRAASVSVDWMGLVDGEMPSQNPAVFERQRFPRRSVAELGERLSEVAA